MSELSRALPGWAGIFLGGHLGCFPVRDVRATLDHDHAGIVSKIALDGCLGTQQSDLGVTTRFLEKSRNPFCYPLVFLARSKQFKFILGHCPVLGLFRGRVGATCLAAQG